VAGLSPELNGIWEALVSDYQWEFLKPILDSQLVPYKVADPSGTERVPFNGADW
jgi:hypothetical protein